MPIDFTCTNVATYTACVTYSLSLTIVTLSARRTHTCMQANKHNTVTSCLSASLLVCVCAGAHLNSFFRLSSTPFPFHSISLDSRRKSSRCRCRCHCLLLTNNHNQSLALVSCAKCAARREGEGVACRSACAQVRWRERDRKIVGSSRRGRSFVSSFSQSVSLSYSLCRLFLFAPLFWISLLV